MENILEWAHSVLTTTPIRWENIAHTLPAELLTRPPVAGEWSALECLQHHPLWQEIDQASERYQEVPYTRLAAKNRVNTGYIDLLYRSADGWQIVDFKTDLLRILPLMEPFFQCLRWLDGNPG